jgi:hypothetical protein
MDTLLDLALRTRRPLRVTVTTRITAMDTVIQADTIAIGNNTSESRTCFLVKKSF